MATAVSHDAQRANLARPASIFVGYAGKRGLDFIVSLLALIMLAPLMMMLGLAIRMTSAGPVFFRQRRLGLGESPFWILKFRSMRVDAATTGPQYTVANDPRITPVGRMLRKTSLDELPQLINVLKGDMSLIGPRPYVGFELDGWSDEERALRASVRPGISGMSQAFGRSGLTPEQIKSHDLRYVRRCSLLLDFGLILRTIRVVLLSRGTN